MPPTATADAPLKLKDGDKLGRLPVDEDPADFLPDPERRANHVLHVPSCNRARVKQPTLPRAQWPAEIAYTVKVGENVTQAKAFLHDGVYYEVGSGDVYHVHRATYERLTGEEGIMPPSAVPIGREVTISLQQQLDATKSTMEAMSAELALLRAGKNANAAAGK